MALAPAADRTAATIEALLSTRLFLQPQLAGDRVYFLSNLGGHLSLYRMEVDGGVPEPLLPPRIALQNPELVVGRSFEVLPEEDRIVVMIDHDGDERYAPHSVPLEGGFPEPLNRAAFGSRSHLLDVDPRAGIGYFMVESSEEALMRGVRADLVSGEAETLAESPYGAFPVAWSRDHGRVVLADGYTAADTVLYERDPASGERRMLWGTPLDERPAGMEHPRSGFRSGHFTAAAEGLLLVTSLFADDYGPAYLPLGGGEVESVSLEGVVHQGAGELEGLERLEDDRYLVFFNIDGESWAYVGQYEHERRALALGRVLCGRGELEGGVLHGLRHDPVSGRYVAAFCTATTPTQLHVLPADGDEGTAPRRLTRERPLGLSPEELSAGEDASFGSHDGLRVSARLYLPPPEAGYEGPRPVVNYVHGGPQGQERPDFAWFSMPLIQILAMSGFAVFVPNARGSTGYGLDYMDRVNRDWGGLDRLDHVHAFTEVLPRDERLDTTRSAVIGRSYGGYMTLMLAGRHPELWAAAVDMFGPYDLASFIERVPPTWRPYLLLTLGDPERDADFLRERSPRTYVSSISCPLLVIQGRNDPRVVEAESGDLVEELRAAGRSVEYLVFDDEGHDVLKLANRIRCYETITRFLREHLRP